MSKVEISSFAGLPGVTLHKYSFLDVLIFDDINSPASQFAGTDFQLVLWRSGQFRAFNLGMSISCPTGDNANSSFTIHLPVTFNCFSGPNRNVLTSFSALVARGNSGIVAALMEPLSNPSNPPTPPGGLNDVTIFMTWPSGINSTLQTEVLMQGLFLPV